MTLVKLKSDDTSSTISKSSYSSWEYRKKSQQQCKNQKPAKKSLICCCLGKKKNKEDQNTKYCKIPKVSSSETSSSATIELFCASSTSDDFFYAIKKNFLNRKKPPVKKPVKNYKFKNYKFKISNNNIIRSVPKKVACDIKPQTDINQKKEIQQKQVEVSPPQKNQHSKEQKCETFEKVATDVIKCLQTHNRLIEDIKVKLDSKIDENYRPTHITKQTLDSDRKLEFIAKIDHPQVTSSPIQNQKGNMPESVVPDIQQIPQKIINRNNYYINHILPKAMSPLLKTIVNKEIKQEPDDSYSKYIEDIDQTESNVCGSSNIIEKACLNQKCTPKADSEETSTGELCASSASVGYQQNHKSHKKFQSLNGNQTNLVEGYYSKEFKRELSKRLEQNNFKNKKLLCPPKDQIENCTPKCNGTKQKADLVKKCPEANKLEKCNIKKSQNDQFIGTKDTKDIAKKCPPKTKNQYDECLVTNDKKDISKKCPPKIKNKYNGCIDNTDKKDISKKCPPKITNQIDQCNAIKDKKDIFKQCSPKNQLDECINKKRKNGIVKQCLPTNLTQGCNTKKNATGNMKQCQPCSSKDSDATDISMLKHYQNGRPIYPQTTNNCKITNNQQMTDNCKTINNGTLTNNCKMANNVKTTKNHKMDNYRKMTNNHKISCKPQAPEQPPCIESSSSQCEEIPIKESSLCVSSNNYVENHSNQIIPQNGKHCYPSFCYCSDTDKWVLNCGSGNYELPFTFCNGARETSPLIIKTDNVQLLGYIPPHNIQMNDPTYLYEKYKPTYKTGKWGQKNTPYKPTQYNKGQENDRDILEVIENESNFGFRHDEFSPTLELFPR